MQTIGERLLEARQRRGASIREAAEATKVRGDYLMAMEANQFEAIPLADVYKRGFLKIYARFLRLDSDRLTAEFNSLLAARLPHGARTRRVTELNESAGRPSEIREPESPDEFATGAIEFAERPDNRKRTLTIAATLVGGLLLLTAIAIKSCGGSTVEKPAEPTPVAPVAVQGEIRLTCINTAPTPVRLVRLSDNTTVFDRTMRQGDSTVINTVGAHELSTTAMDKIHFNINGGQTMAYPAGYPKVTLDIPAKQK